MDSALLQIRSDERPVNSFTSPAGPTSEPAKREAARDAFFATESGVSQGADQDS